MKVKIFLTIAAVTLVSFASPVFSQDYVSRPDPLEDSARMANRRTAIRCLTLAKDYALQGEWESVVSQISMGLSYDGAVSDLWYMLAVAEKNLGKTKAVASAYLERALKENTWVDYNRDAARVFYADILCDTQRYADVFPVIDGNAKYAGNPCYVNAPYIYSADAEYVRAKAYYRLGDQTSLEMARVKIDTARRMYPSDIRFPQVFFKYENPSVVNADVSRMARLFIAQIMDHKGAYYDENSTELTTELEILCIPFADAQSRDYMLRSFNARGLKHPLYAVLALQYNLISDRQALDYISRFADSQISYDALSDFLSLLEDEQVKSLTTSYLKAYNGLIGKDTDGDKIINLYVQYSRGRPQTVYYDKNQDGVYEWSVDCDFGTPVGGVLYSERMEFTWGRYPDLRTVDFRDETGANVQSYTLVPGGLQWSPLRMVADKNLSAKAGFTFYYPVLNTDYVSSAGLAESDVSKRTPRDGIDTAKLFNAASSITVPSGEREGASITFSILYGKIQLARYYQGKKQYAQAEFENGNPVLRVVDANDDGVFETTEIYGIDKTGEMDVHTLRDEQAIMENLFGLPSVGSQYYLKMIQVDSGVPDTVPDFTEEYLARGGKISSWDTDGDGSWDIRYYRHSMPKNEPEAPVVEETMFFGANSDLIRVVSENSVPVSVKTAFEELPISEDAIYRFYWIGVKGNSAQAKAVIQALNKKNITGDSIVVSVNGVDIQAIRLDGVNYGIILNGNTF